MVSPMTNDPPVQLGGNPSSVPSRLATFLQQAGRAPGWVQPVVVLAGAHPAGAFATADPPDWPVGVLPCELERLRMHVVLASTEYQQIAATLTRAADQARGLEPGG